MSENNSAKSAIIKVKGYGYFFIFPYQLSTARP